MFLVSDKRDDRYEKIRSFITKDTAAIAVLLSAANFEWTLRRAIVALSKTPNKTARSDTLRRCHGLDQYNRAWKQEVTPHHGRRLPNIISKWSFLAQPTNGAYVLRHKLIHGDQGSTGIAYARERVEALIRAAQEVDAFCQSKNVDLFKRLPIKKRPATKERNRTLSNRRQPHSKSRN